MRRTVPERERITIDSVSTPVADHAHASQQRSARHAGRGDEDVLALDEVVGGQHPVEVVAGVDADARAPRRYAATASPAWRRRGT